MCNNSSCGCHNNHCNKFGPFKIATSKCVESETTKADRSSIIVFSSGVFILPIVEFSTGGAIETVSSIGFGSSVNGITLTNQGEIDLLETTYTDDFIIPRPGSLTAISVTYKSIIESKNRLELGSGIATINARIYRAAKGSNLLTPTDASVNLTPTLTGSLSNVITMHSGSSSTFTPVPIDTDDCLLIVFSISVSGNPTVVGAAVKGTASAGITIE